MFATTYNSFGLVNYSSISFSLSHFCILFAFSNRKKGRTCFNYVLLWILRHASLASKFFLFFLLLHLLNLFSRHFRKKDKSINWASLVYLVTLTKKLPDFVINKFQWIRIKRGKKRKKERRNHISWQLWKRESERIAYTVKLKVFMLISSVTISLLLNTIISMLFYFIKVFFF